jgi:hypothetical protein
MLENAELLQTQGDYSLMRWSGRRFPGLLIQGDTLSILCDDLEEIMSLLDGGDQEEAEFALSEVCKRVNGMRKSYEEMMDAESMSLPYRRTST